MIGDEIRYMNHLGESVDLWGDGVYADMSAFDNWKWGHALQNSRISAFRKEPTAFAMPLVVAAGSENAGAAVRNRLYEVAEKDILAREPGRLYYGGWYLRCYISESSKAHHWRTLKVAEYALTVLADEPMWTLEHVKAVTKDSHLGGANYAFNFPINLSASSESVHIDNPGFTEAPVAITVYGPAVNPAVTIGGNRYEVEATVASGGRLEIDGLSKTITLYDRYGGAENAFGKRRGVQRKGSGSYVFQRAPVGANLVSWDGSFAFDVTLYEQRGERRWRS